jgi:uncharacterized protein (TIGR01589 family)
LIESPGYGEFISVLITRIVTWSGELSSTHKAWFERHIFTLWVSGFRLGAPVADRRHLLLAGVGRPKMPPKKQSEPVSAPFTLALMGAPLLGSSAAAMPAAAPGSAGGQIPALATATAPTSGAIPPRKVPALSVAAIPKVVSTTSSTSQQSAESQQQQPEQGGSGGSRRLPGLLPKMVNEACVAAFGDADGTGDPQVVANARVLLCRCLWSYLSPDEIATLMQSHAGVPPAATRAALTALEAGDRDFFRGYHFRLRLKEQIEAFNLLVTRTAQETLVPKLAEGEERRGEKRKADEPIDGASVAAVPRVAGTLSALPPNRRPTSDTKELDTNTFFSS